MSDGAAEGALACGDAERFLDALVDGEVDGAEEAALAAHVAACADCARHVAERTALKSRLRGAHPPSPLPEGLRARIDAALTDAVADSERGSRRRTTRRLAAAVIPVAFAAGMALSVGLSSKSPSMLAQSAIARHQRNLPVDVRGDEAAVRAFLASRVGLAVRPPRLPSATLVGARLADVRDREAALLVYDLAGERVTVLVFDPSGVPLEAPRHRDLGGREVYLDGERGYHVALYRDRGLGYAITSDLDEDRMLQLISTAVGD